MFQDPETRRLQSRRQRHHPLVPRTDYGLAPQWCTGNLIGKRRRSWRRRPDPLSFLLGGRFFAFQLHWQGTAIGGGNCLDPGPSSLCFGVSSGISGEG